MTQTSHTTAGELQPELRQQKPVCYDLGMGKLAATLSLVVCFQVGAQTPTSKPTSKPVMSILKTLQLKQFTMETQGTLMNMHHVRLDFDGWRNSPDTVVKAVKGWLPFAKKSLVQNVPDSPDQTCATISQFIREAEESFEAEVPALEQAVKISDQLEALGKETPDEDRETKLLREVLAKKLVNQMVTIQMDLIVPHTKLDMAEVALDQLRMDVFDMEIDNNLPH